MPQGWELSLPHVSLKIQETWGQKCQFPRWCLGLGQWQKTLELDPKREQGSPADRMKDVGRGILETGNVRGSPSSRHRRWAQEGRTGAAPLPAMGQRAGSGGSQLPPRVQSAASWGGGGRSTHSFIHPPSVCPPGAHACVQGAQTPDRGWGHIRGWWGAMSLRAWGGRPPWRGEVCPET